MPRITMVIGAFNRPNSILVTLHSLLIQSVQDFEIVVVHDGSGPIVREKVLELGDPRIRYEETEYHCNDWGNTSKELGSALARGEFIGHSNDDNYYAPLYFQRMLEALDGDQADFAYCNMVHSHLDYAAFETHPLTGSIDGGGWVCKTTIVKSTPWPDPKRDPLADGKYVEALLPKCQRVVKVPGYLFVHN